MEPSRPKEPLTSGWYPDPIRPQRERRWDGTEWTDDVRAVAETVTDPPSRFVAIATQGDVCMALHASGRVAVWGAFLAGARAFAPPGLTDVVAIATSGAHCLVALSDGSVRAWGIDGYGRTDVPDGLRGVVAVAAGIAHNLALLDDSTVVAWGDNSDGECNVPLGLSGVKSIYIIGGVSVAICRDGSVVTWGGKIEYHPELTELNKMQGVLSVSGKSVLLANGTISTIGGSYGNRYGRSLVEAPTHIADFVSVTDGGPIRYGLRENGAVVAWGTPTSMEKEAVPEGLTNVSSIETTGFHTLALLQNGSIVAWGSNALGALEVPTSDGFDQPVGKVLRSFPKVEIPEGSALGFVAVAAGASHSIALRNDGTVAVWGDNLLGQRNIPEGLSGVVAIAAGRNHSIALLVDGTVITWGASVGGPISQPEGLTGVVQIAAGEDRNIALLNNGTAILWSQGFSNPQPLPASWAPLASVGLGPLKVAAVHRTGSLVLEHERETPPSGFSDVTNVTVSADATYVLEQASGKLTRWGTSSGVGLIFGQDQIIQFPGNPSDVLYGIVKIDAGWNHALAVRSDGSVLAWGDNDYQKAEAPKTIQGAVDVAAGNNHSLVALSDGTVIGWGDNADGQLEIPRPNDSSVAEERVRVSLEFNFRTSRATSGVRSWRFNFGELAPIWIYGHRTEEVDLDYIADELDPFSNLVYEVVALSVFERHFPSLKKDSSIKVEGVTGEISNLPIAVTGRVSVHKGEFDAFLALVSSVGPHSS